MKLKPLADRVLIQPTAAEEVTASGIIIPDSAKENLCAAPFSPPATAPKTKK